METKIRTLQPNEIDCRVGSVNATGFSILLYKDARVDMKILDEVYGSKNWQRTHEVINGNLFCNIEIWDDTKKCWVKKQDVGTESFTEKEKGEASDSFKRAGFNWGIGRELYTAPFIWITGYDNCIEKKAGTDKHTVKSSLKLHVTKIEYNEENEIIKLEIKDNYNKVAFSYGYGKVQQVDNQNNDDEKLKLLVEFEKLVNATDSDKEKIYSVYKVKNNTEMTIEQFKDAIKVLKQKPILKKEEVF
jgi:hypothetical protein